MTIIQKYATRSAIPNLQQAIGAMLKIESTLPQEIRDYCGSALEMVAVRPPPLSDASTITDTFNMLWRATCKHQAVELVYDSYYERADSRSFGMLSVY